jgi:C4-dicarboxylate-specific signal transduction histidine kinase
VDRAALIIGHLRQFGRKAESTMSPVDVNTPIRAAFTLLGTQLIKAGIDCELTLDEDLPPIMGDANRLEQVFINLVINARDAMLAHEQEAGPDQSMPKTLTIKSYQEGDRVVVIVSDTGPGVAPELRSRIFEPFFTTKKIGEGTGVGLSVSYGIIKEHQGTIEVNGHDQPGATFTLTFPVLDQPVETTHDEDFGH